MPKSKSKGKRYTDKEKAAVLAFVEKTNTERGRGGITAAAKKFKVTPLTISNWIKATGLPAPGTARKAKPGFEHTLKRLGEVHDLIVTKQDELAKLQKEYLALKKKL